MRIPSACSERPAFTLIEMLVVISIIVLLAAMALFVTPAFSEQQKTSMGASSVQGWLFVAKQRAYRDGLTRGVAFIPASDNNNWVRQLQYIEQPDDFSRGAVATTAGVAAATLSLPAGMDASTFIQAGDILVLTGVTPPEVHRITGITSPGTLTLGDPVSAAAASGITYKIIRGPQVLAGEPLLNLTQDVIVDFSTPTGFSGPLSQTSQGGVVPQMPLATSPTGLAWYVLFSPQGGLQLGTGNTTGKVTFWVRDSLKDSVTDGQPTLITVYARSGAIGAFLINTDPTLGSFYFFTQNGLNSGDVKPMYALATIARRRAVTLTEVLVAIFIMAIGLMALLTLFPLGALNMAQAIKDDRTGTSGSNAAAVGEAAWRILYELNSATPDGNLNARALNSGKGFWPNLPDLTGTVGASYPVYLDPFGYNGVYGNGGNWQNWLAGTPGTIPRWSATKATPPQTGLITNWANTCGYFANNDDLTFSPETGCPPVGNVQRQRQYSWAFLVRQVSCADATQLNLTVVVYSGRPLQPTADLVPQGETLYPGSFAGNTVTLTWAPPQDKPAVRRGSWILDATVLPLPGGGGQGGNFYRVTDITELGGNTLLLELQTPVQAPSGPGVNSSVIVLDGVSEVFQKPPLAGQY